MHRQEQKIKDEEKAFRERVGERLREARRRTGKSLQEVADHFSLSKAAIGHWETGTNPPDIGRLFRLARYYGTTVTELVADPLSRDQLTTMLAMAVLEADRAQHLDPDATAKRAPSSKQLRTGT